MTLQGCVEKCVVMCVVLGTLVAQASAHGSEDIPTGIMTVPPSGTASITIAYANPSDTIQWEWKASVPERVSGQLLWQDLRGRDNALAPDTSQQPFGMFVAPADLTEARLVWRNTGDTPAKVEWVYHVSAPFWRHPDMVLPALIPFFFLIAAYPLGRAIDTLRERAGYR
jgi:hypothetical protein